MAPQARRRETLADIHEWIGPTRGGSPALTSTPLGEGVGTNARSIITGSGGLIGSESVEHFIAEGFDVVGIENDLRARFFGPEASTAQSTERLVDDNPSFVLGGRRHS